MNNLSKTKLIRMYARTIYDGFPNMNKLFIQLNPKHVIADQVCKMVPQQLLEEKFKDSKDFFFKNFWKKICVCIIL